jgi:hypothetical protein
MGWYLPLAAVMPLDVASALLGWRQGQNDLRLITGVLWGIFGSAAVLSLLARLHSHAILRRAQAPAPSIRQATSMGTSNGVAFAKDWGNNIT